MNNENKKTKKTLKKTFLRMCVRVVNALKISYSS